MATDMDTTTGTNHRERAGGPGIFKVEDTLDIAGLVDDLWNGVKRHWLLILVVMSVCATVYFYRLQRSYTPVYQASSTFLVNTSNAVNYSYDYYNVKAAEQIAKTFPYIISNSALRKIIAKDLGVSSIPGSIKATALEETNMITISAVSYSPQMAYDILQSVLNNYTSVAREVIGNTNLIFMNESGMPTEPVNVQGSKFQPLMGSLIGLLVCLGVIALHSMLKQTIRQEDDIRTLLAVPCMGSIPRVKFKRRSGKQYRKVLVSNPRVPYGFNEGIRKLRTRLERDHKRTGSIVYLISSAIAGEGKSTLAANLALSMAQTGLKVVLVDMDLRNSSTLEVLGLTGTGRGMADVLTGSAYLNDVLVTDEESGLLVLPAGSAGANAVRLLESEQVPAIISTLKVNAEYVIVDTPPSSLMSDAASLAKYIDGGIFVIRQDFAPVERIKEGIELLTDSGLRLCGCVLNCCEAGITGYGGYGYKYGYGYGRYGTYGKYEKSRKRSRSRGKQKDHIGDDME